MIRRNKTRTLARQRIDDIMTERTKLTSCAMRSEVKKQYFRGVHQDSDPMGASNNFAAAGVFLSLCGKQQAIRYEALETLKGHFE